MVDQGAAGKALMLPCCQGQCATIGGGGRGGGGSGGTALPQQQGAQGHGAHPAGCWNHVRRNVRRIWSVFGALHARQEENNAAQAGQA